MVEIKPYSFFLRDDFFGSKIPSLYIPADDGGVAGANASSAFSLLVAPCTQRILRTSFKASYIGEDITDESPFGQPIVDLLYDDRIISAIVRATLMVPDEMGGVVKQPSEVIELHAVRSDGVHIGLIAPLKKDSVAYKDGKRLLRKIDPRSIDDLLLSRLGRWLEMREHRQESGTP